MSHARFPDFAAPAPVSRPCHVAVLEPAPVCTPVSVLDRVGETLAAVLIVGGAAALVGFASLL